MLTFSSSSSYYYYCCCFYYCYSFGLFIVVLLVLWPRLWAHVRRSLVTEPTNVFKTEESFTQFYSSTKRLKDLLDGTLMDKTGNQLVAEAETNIDAIIFDEAMKFASTFYIDDVNMFKAVLIASDLRLPHYWYPEARLRKRKIIFHGGPTNSGTFNLQHTCARFISIGVGSI